MHALFTEEWKVGLGTTEVLCVDNMILGDKEALPVPLCSVPDTSSASMWSSSSCDRLKMCSSSTEYINIQLGCVVIERVVDGRRRLKLDD